MGSSCQIDFLRSRRERREEFTGCKGIGWKPTLKLIYVPVTWDEIPNKTNKTKYTKRSTIFKFSPIFKQQTEHLGPYPFILWYVYSHSEIEYSCISIDDPDNVMFILLDVFSPLEPEVKHERPISLQL